MASLEFELSPAGLRSKFLSAMQSNSGRREVDIPSLPIAPTGKRTREQMGASHSIPVSMATEDPTLFEFDHFLKDAASCRRDDFLQPTLNRTDSTDSIRTIVPKRKLTRTVAQAHITFPIAVTDARKADALFASSPSLPFGPLPSTGQSTIAFPTKKPSSIDSSTKPTASQDDSRPTSARPRKSLSRSQSSVNILDDGHIRSMAVAMAKPVPRRNLDGFDLSETSFGDFPVLHIEATQQDNRQDEPMDLDDEDIYPSKGDNAEGTQEVQLRDRYVVTIQPDKRNVTIWDAPLGTACLWIGSLKVVNTAVCSIDKFTCSAEPRVINMIVRFSTHRVEDGEALTEDHPSNPEYTVQFRGRRLTQPATTNAFHTSDLSEICVEPHWRWWPSVSHSKNPSDMPAHYLEFYVPVPLSLWDNSGHRCEYRRFRIDAELTFQISEDEHQVAKAKPVLVGIDRLFKTKHMDGSPLLAERLVDNSAVRKTCKPPTVPLKPKKKFFL